MVLEVVGPWVGVGLAFSGPTLLCLAMVSFFGGHNSGTSSMATAISAGAATTGVRGHTGLCLCAVTMATAVSAGAATAGVRGGIGLCCCAVTMAYMFSHPHPQCIISISQTVRKRPHPKD